MERQCLVLDEDHWGAYLQLLEKAIIMHVELGEANAVCTFRITASVLT